MNSQDVFELFNHFLSTGDTGQILPISDNLEVFTSATFSDGKTRIGSEAPEGFRNMISQISQKNKPVSIELEHAAVEDNSAIFLMNIYRGRKTSGSTLNILLSDGQVKCFHETRAIL